MVIELHSHVPSKTPVPASPETDLASIMRRLEALEETITQITAASQLDAVLPLYSEAQRRQVS